MHNYTEYVYCNYTYCIIVTSFLLKPSIEKAL